MKFLFIALIAFTIIGCGTKKTKTSIPVDKPVLIDTSKKTEAISSFNGNLSALLKSNQIISQNYPVTKLKLISTHIISKNEVFTAIHFPYDTTLQELYESELVFNALMLHNENEIINAHVIDAVDEEDFSLLFSSKHYLVFEFYSSPVGYTIYYIFDINDEQLLKSEPVEEGYIIDTSKINFESKSIMTSFNETYKEYSLTKIW